MITDKSGRIFDERRKTQRRKEDIQVAEERRKSERRKADKVAKK